MTQLGKYFQKLGGYIYAVFNTLRRLRDRGKHTYIEFGTYLHFSVHRAGNAQAAEYNLSRGENNKNSTGYGRQYTNPCIRPKTNEKHIYFTQRKQ